MRVTLGVWGVSAVAGKGFAPSGQRSRESDQRRDEALITEVAADGELRGPDLPDGDWPSWTRHWWATWRRSAQAATFTTTDWDFLLETALLHAAYVGGQLAYAAELRLRVAKYGATPEDRMRLRLSITEPDAKPAATDDEVAAKRAAREGRRKRLEEAAVDG